MKTPVCIALAATVAASAAAQNVARPDPADPKATVPSRPYESAFKDYRPYADPDIARWRESNDNAGRLGGHTGHVPKAADGKARPDATSQTPGAPGGHK